MKFLQKRQNEKSFTKSEYVVLSYEQLLQVNGAGGSSSGGGGPSGPSGNLTDRGYPSSTEGYNTNSSTNSNNSSSSNNSPNAPSYSNTKIQTTIDYSKTSYAVVEGVGLVSESIKQGCYTDSNNKLTVSNMGLFSDKNNTSSVDSYEFFGEITLVIDGREVETKQITTPSGSNIWDGNYDYIGNVTFDTTIPSYGSVEIKSNIDMLVNNSAINFATNTNKLR